MHPQPQRDLPWPYSYELVLLTSEEEGLRLTAYQCPAQVGTSKWSCGWGETDGVTADTVWTKAYADERFCDGLSERAAFVRRLVTIDSTEEQIAALTDLQYNWGKLKGSRVLAAHNAGDFEACARLMQKVNKYTDPASGKLLVHKVLDARRRKWASVYIRPRTEAGEQQSPPQIVEDERPVSASRTVRTASVSGAVAAVGMAGKLKEQLGPVGEFMTTLGEGAAPAINFLRLDSPYLPWGILACAAAYVAWLKISDMRKGLA
jgi:lysozyme